MSVIRRLESYLV